MSRRPMHLACLTLVAACATAALPGAVRAQDDPPAIQSFTVTDISGNLFVESRYRSEDKDRTATGTSTQTDDLLFREGLEVDMAGYAYHPNLADWRANFRVGGIQQFLTVDSQNRDSEGVLLGYDLSIMLLKQKDVSARVYATGTNDVIDRSFARPIDITSYTQGLLLSGRGDFPWNFEFQYRMEEEVNDTRTDDETGYLMRLNVTDGRDPDWWSSLSLVYENIDAQSVFDSAGTSFTQDLPDERIEANFLNNYTFGPEDLRHRLTGQARVLRRTGFFNNDNFLLNQQLDLAHTPTLSSFYRALVSLDETDDSSDRSLEGEAGFRKRIYESLDVFGRAYARDRVLDDGTERAFGVEFEFDYRKTIPVGMYRANLLVGREIAQEDFGSGLRNVRDEAVTLTGITRVRLSRPNVNQATIVVTDSNNLFLYIEGVDYIVSTFGAFTEIQRLVTGNIADGETVLVDYTAQASTASDYSTDLLVLRQRVEFEKLRLAVYTELRYRVQTLESGTDPGNLEDEQGILFGAEYNLFDVLLTAEYEVRELLLSPPFTAYRFRANYTRPLGDAAALTAHAFYEHTDYDNPAAFGLTGPNDDFLDSMGGGVTLTSRINRHTLIRLDALYFDTTGREEDALTRLGGSVLWKYGQIEASIDGHYDLWRQETDEGTTVFLGFKIKRYF